MIVRTMECSIFLTAAGIENLDDRKEAITVQNLLDMTSGIEWTQPLDGSSFESAIEMEAQFRLGQVHSRLTDVERSWGHFQL